MSTGVTVLVTGGTGLVGQAMQAVSGGSPRADERWVYVSSADADLTDLAQTRALFDKHRPTHVMHLAAESGGMLKSMAHLVEMWRTNVAINDNVMLCVKEHKVEKMVSCLNTSIFPAMKEGPMTEAMLHDGPPHHVGEPYAYAKWMADVMSRAYRREYGCNFVCAIATNVYGPGDNFSLSDGHLVATMVHKCNLAKKAGTDMVVFGSGKPLRQFMFAEDLAQLMVWTMRNYNDEEPIILAPDESDVLSGEAVAGMVAEATGFIGKIIFDESKAIGQKRVMASNARMRRYLPDACFTPMGDGISKTVEWFSVNYDTART